MNDEQIRASLLSLAELVFAYELLTDNELSDQTPFQPIYRQLNLRFRTILDDVVVAGGLD